MQRNLEQSQLNFSAFISQVAIATHAVEIVIASLACAQLHARRKVSKAYTHKCMHAV